MDEAGEPVRNATVTVYRESRESGISQIRAALQSTTNDQGTYEATPLNDGTYFVSVTRETVVCSARPCLLQERKGRCLRWWIRRSTSRIRRPITATLRSRMTRRLFRFEVAIKVEADIHVGPVPSLHLIVRLPADGRKGYSMPMLFKPSFDGMERVETGQVNGVCPWRIRDHGNSRRPLHGRPFWTAEHRCTSPPRSN